MGCDCVSILADGTRVPDVEEFLRLLGFLPVKKETFPKSDGKPYYWYKDDNYRYITGLYAVISHDQSDPSKVGVYTRTTIWRSKFDSDLHNHTIRQLKKRFGGHFHSDFGKNRYFKFEGVIREKAESGALMAFKRLANSLQHARHIISFSSLHNDDLYKIHGIEFIDQHNPRIIIANIIVPFLIAAIEEYFRSLYVALLKYSKNRDRLIQAAKLQGADLAAVDRGELTVIDAIAKWKSFQDMQKISVAFKELDSNFDIHGILKRPFGRRKLSFWDEIVRLISQRHGLIHRSELTPDYLPKKLQQDIDMIQSALLRVYEELIKKHNWTPAEKWELGI